MEKSFTPKAIALLSGGLDSALAARVIKDQGIEVIGLHLVSPFGCKNEVQKTADSLGINIVFKEKGEAYLDLVKSPQYGYGKNMNPCVDCRIYMFELAEQVMQEQGAHFIITGEVVGQRPMSQQKQAMQLIDKKSDSENRVLRPLSAHLFPPSLAEINGWVDREKLFGISGRSRTEQLEMAKNLGLENYAAPGGGCLLTESAFSNRLRDFCKHESVDISTEKRLAQSQLLRLGRHFRVDDNCKIIIGRNQQENEELELLWRFADAEYYKPFSFDGPSAVAVGNLHSGHRDTIARTILRYSKPAEGLLPTVQVNSPQGELAVIEVTSPISVEELDSMRL